MTEYNGTGGSRRDKGYAFEAMQCDSSRAPITHPAMVDNVTRFCNEMEWLSHYKI